MEKLINMDKKRLLQIVNRLELSPKDKADLVKEISSKADEVDNRVNNILTISDEWFGQSIDNDFNDINLTNNNDNIVFDMLYHFIIYNNIPICQYSYDNYHIYYLPMLGIHISKNARNVIKNKEFDKINETIDVKFGLAMDDNNEVYTQIKLKYFPDIKHWGINLFEI